MFDERPGVPVRLLLSVKVVREQLLVHFQEFIGAQFPLHLISQELQRLLFGHGRHRSISPVYSHAGTVFYTLLLYSTFHSVPDQRGDSCTRFITNLYGLPPRFVGLPSPSWFAQLVNWR